MAENLNNVQIRPSAFVYLKISDPLVAWLTYRGVMISAGVGDWPGMSSWLALHLFEIDLGAANARQRYDVEIQLEAVRAAQFPSAVSRLRGFFLFPDLESALRAREAWKLPGEYQLVQVGLYSDAHLSQYDSEWITANLMAPGDFSWATNYFAGEARGEEPIWELLVDGRADIWGTAVRKQAHDVVQRWWPDSLALLEIARLGAWLDSDLGRISAHPMNHGDRVRVDYAIDMRDAENPEFLARLNAYYGPKNWAELGGIDEENWFRTPDLRDYAFDISAEYTQRGRRADRLLHLPNELTDNASHGRAHTPVRGR